MDLAAVVSLVLKQMRQQIIGTVVLAARATIHADNAGQILGLQPIHQRQQPRITVDLRLHQSRKRQQSACLVQCCGVQRVAFQGVDVKPIHQQNMVQCRADRRKKTGAGGCVIRSRQPRTGAVQAVVGKPVHLRQFTPDTAGVRG